MPKNMKKEIELIKAIRDYTAPTPSGWVRTDYGWMEAQPELVVIRKVNEIIDWINKNN